MWLDFQNIQNQGKISHANPTQVTCIGLAWLIFPWIFRTFKTREKSAMLTLYKSLVLPHLEYCSVIWAPSTVADLQKLERVQRLLTRNIKDLRNCSYWERLKILKLYSLERRNERYQIIYIFKCLHDLVPNPGVIFQYNVRRGYYCQTRILPRNAKKSTRNLFSHFILNRGPSLFNSLPSYLRQMYMSGIPLKDSKMN